MAVAFIAKYGIDPDLAQVVHKQVINETGGLTITTWFERRPPEPSAPPAPAMPEKWELPDGDGS